MSTEGRRVRLEHRATEVALLEVEAGLLGTRLTPSVVERAPLSLSAEGHPMDLHVREVV